MENKAYALEWMQKALHDLEGVRLLYESNHYTDTVGYVLHQSLEKILKAMSAYRNKPIRKTHNLVELYELLEDRIDLDEDEIFLLSIATTYQTKQRYPIAQKKLPPREEIKEVLDFTSRLFEAVLKKLEINIGDIK